MNFWDWLYRLGPGWPTERQWASIMTWALAAGMLAMTVDRPDLWREELFKTLITVVVITGFVNLILGFHFAANKNDETKAENTGAAFHAIATVAAAANADQDRPSGNAGDPVHVEEDK